MLSRVADALFWMSRYLVRAEQGARLLDVAFHLDLDVHSVISRPSEAVWENVAAAMVAPPPPDLDQQPTGVLNRISCWMMFDQANPNSIASCVAHARANARMIRGTISTPMWKALNKLYWQLADADFVRQAHESPHEFFQSVQSGSSLFQGICDTTLTHDEGWQFIQVGKYLEQADKTLRIVDIQYHELQEQLDQVNPSLANLQWAAMLRSCRAYEAYQKLYVGRIDPQRVVEFLLLHPKAPHSVRFSLTQAQQALASVEENPAVRAESKADRMLGKVLSDLTYVELDKLLDGELHAFLTRLIEQSGQASQLVQNQYCLR